MRPLLAPKKHYHTSRAAEEMRNRGIEPDSPEAQLFGRKLLKALTDVFGRCILETGFFHAGMSHLLALFVFFYDILLTFFRRVRIVIIMHAPGSMV